jgi:hypothetical protein
LNLFFWFYKPNGPKQNHLNEIEVEFESKGARSKS